eukprot:1138831-Pelagomonas_calceolata.AAC.2
MNTLHSTALCFSLAQQACRGKLTEVPRISRTFLLMSPPMTPLGCPGLPAACLNSGIPGALGWSHSAPPHVYPNTLKAPSACRAYKYILGIDKF